MATAATATIRLDGDSAALSRELKKANRNVNSAFRGMKADAERLAAGMAVIATAAAAAFTVLVKHSLEASDALAKQADRMGVGTEALKTMQVAADLAGVSQEQLTKSLQKQQVAIFNAATAGGQQALVFAKLGLSIKDLLTLSVDQQFQKIAEALNNVENTTVRNALAMQVWGKGSAEMVNFAREAAGGLGELRAGLEQTNAAISRFDAAKIEQANDAITLAKTAVEGLGNTLATTLAPIIQGVSEEFLNAAREGNGFRTEAEAALAAVASAAGHTSDAVLGIGLVFKELAGASLVALGAIQGAMAGVGRGVETFIINPFLGALELLLRMQALLPGPLGRASAEMANIAAATRNASGSTASWNDALTKSAAGLDLIRRSWDETVNRELPSTSIDKWVERVQTASNAAAAAMARTASISALNVDQVNERLKAATAELEHLRGIRLDIDAGQAKQHIAGVGTAIRQLQEQIAQVKKTELALRANPEALVAVRDKLKDLDIALAESKKRLADLKVGKVDTSALEREIQLLERRGEAQRSSSGGVTVPAPVDTAGILKGAANAAAAREALERATNLEIQRIAISGTESTTAELVRLVETRANLITGIEERAAAAQAAAAGTESRFEREKELAKNRVAVAQEAAQQLLKVRQSVVNAGWFIDLKVTTDVNGLTGLQAELEGTRQKIAAVQAQRIEIYAALSDPSALQRDIDKLKTELASVEPLAIQANTGALKAAERDIAVLSGQLNVLTDRRIDIVASLPGLAKVEGEIARLQAQLKGAQSQRLDLDPAGAIAALAAVRSQIAELTRQQTELVVTASTGPAQAELRAVRDQLDALRTQETTLAVTAAIEPATVALAALQDQLDALRADEARLAVTATTAPALAALAGVREQLDALTSQEADLRVRAEAGPAQAVLGALRAEIATLTAREQTLVVTVAAAPAHVALTELRAQIADLSRQQVTLSAHATTETAVARLTDLQERLAALRAQEATLTVTAETELPAAALAGLQEQLTALRAEEVRLSVTVAAEPASASLSALQDQLTALQEQRLTLTADATALTDTEQRLAGLRADLSHALSARVELSGATEAAGRVKELQKEIAALEDRQLAVSVATSGVDLADRQLADLQRQLTAIESVKTTLPVDSQALADATAEADRLRAAIATVADKKVTITAAWEGLQQMEPQLARLRTEMDALQTRRLELTADSQAYLEAGSRLEALQAQVSTLEQQRVHLIADLDDAGVKRELTALDAQLTELYSRLAHPPQVGGFAVDMSAAVAALEQTSARQKELAQQSAEEIRRIVIGGEEQISQELLTLIEARVQAVAAAQQRQQAFEAALTGNPAVFDQEKVLGAARVQLANEVADQVITARQRMAEGGAISLPTVDPAAIQAQTEQATAQYLSAWQLANEQRVLAEGAVHETLRLSEEQAGAALIELAAKQASEKVLAEFTARNEALDQTGQFADPAVRAAFEQQVQDETLAREAEFLNQRLALQQQFGSEFIRTQDAIAAVFGQKWAVANKTALSNYSAFATAASAIGSVLFANNKKWGIANALISTYVGVAKALELPFPANLAAAATVLATGMQQVAAIRSSSPGGGGGLGGGISSGAVSVAPSATNFGGNREADTRSAVQVIIQGDVLGWDDFVQSKVIDSLRDALDGRDVVIFHGGSLQAKEIRDGN